MYLRTSTAVEPVLGAITAVAGSQQRIECVANGGSPPPQLKWRLAGREVAGAQTRLDAAGNAVSTINLSMTKGDHGKTIRCEATHPALTSVVDVKSFLDVQCKLPFSLEDILKLRPRV